MPVRSQTRLDRAGPLSYPPADRYVAGRLTPTP